MGTEGKRTQRSTERKNTEKHREKILMGAEM